MTTNTFIHDIEALENVIFVCFGKPTDLEIPQIANEHDVMVDLVHQTTGKPLDLVEAEINHQTETTYQ